MNNINVFTSFFMAFLDEDEFIIKRQIMVEKQIKARGVCNNEVLRAFMEVPRHKFLMEKYYDSAYDDHPLPIDCQQTISQPYIVALMTEALELKPEYRVLEIGTGSGYQTAILSRLVKEVFTIEIFPILFDKAKQVFENLGYKNINMSNKDGYNGWKEQGLFDAIVVTCASEDIPAPLVNQLKVGGRMVIPVGANSIYGQELVLVKKTNETDYETENLCGVIFVRLIREI